MKTKQLVLVLAAALILAALLFFNPADYLTLEALKANHGALVNYTQANLGYALLIYAAVYIAVTGLSLPGAAVLTLAGGAVFGLLWGVVVVSFASTIGATLAFLLSRYLFRDSVEKRFGDRLYRINQGLEREGPFYLFALRLVPLFPFFMINLLMGLTSFKTLAFFWVSQLGMLPGTIAYVNAGTQLAQIDSLSGILSPAIIASFAVLGLLPLLSRRFIDWLRSRKVYATYERPAEFDYNTVVIGAGSGGLVASYISAALKAKVALIEKHRMGGDCLNTGCVPSKALIRTAKVLAHARRAKDFGLERLEAEYDFETVMDRVQQVIKTVEPHDSVERYTSLGVECIEGEAKILDPWRVQVNGRELSARNIIVATGGRPFVPDLPGLNEAPHYTSDTIWDIREQPKKLVVLGGGPIGVELAQCFHRLGSEVTIVQRGPRILPKEDQEVSEFVAGRFAEEGIVVATKTAAEKVVTDDAGANSLLCVGPDGAEVKYEFDALLLALGRRANTRGFGLEELGVCLDKSGTIAADEFLRTNIPNIYVCGDVAGPYQFTHFASHQAWYASVNALFSPLKSFKADYRVIPWCTFTDPEVARVGLNEQEAQAKGIPFEVTRYGIDDLDRAIADSEAEGFVKVLTPPGRDAILGVTIVGVHAGDILAEFVLAMKYRLGLNKILGTIHIYPTLAEANKYAAGVWKRNHAPQGALKWLSKYHSWRRGGKTQAAQ